MEVTVVEYSREPHAAHYGRYAGERKGHDLERWTFASPINARPIGVPANTEYHVGFLRDGVQHWVYVRIAPLSAGTCPRCKGAP